MVLHCEIYQEDAVTAATAGLAQGGLAIVTGSLRGWDGITRQGSHDTFRDFFMVEVDVRSDEVPAMAQATVRFKKWPSDRILHKWAEIHGDETTSAGTIHLNYNPAYMVDGDFNYPIAERDSILAAETKAYATEANSDIGIAYVFSNGPTYPTMKPGCKYRENTIKAGDVSEGATTADTLNVAFNQALISGTANSPTYFDPDKQYIAYGVGYVGAAVNDLDTICKAELTTGINKGASMAGIGPGVSLTHVETIYTFDGIPFKGDDQWQFGFISGAASTPHGYIIACEQ